MCMGPLFGNNPSRNASKNLVEFKAGKMTMKGKMVYPDTRKGQVYVHQSDDQLMHFCWKDRTTGIVEDDLIIFPDDCEFKHVPACKSGRVYLLRFKSSSRKFFFWLQDLKTDKDEEYCRKINEVLNNPPTPGSQRSGNANPDGDFHNLLNNMSQQQLMQLFGGVGQIGLGSLLGTMSRPHGIQSTRASTTTASSPVTTSVARPPVSQTPAPSTVTETTKSSSNNKSSPRTTAPSTPVTTSGTNNRIQLSDLQSFLSEIPTPAGAEAVVQQRGIATELTNVIPTITRTESLERAISAHLPPGDNLCTTLSSPQFSQALSMFWSALQSGQAGPVIRQFGLGTDAINAATSGNIEEFVTALETEAKSGQGQAQQGQEEKKRSPGDSPGKKEDDDDGMPLD
ncbi:proteasomal ubiquitin receptor ADRM1 isoform X1 [Vespula maculifrons]|uniref:Proteasomal ubiquitin receptor ADRM1 homolog n=1 Tax=Vespula maculifrons TaxID=7453 RepID=A0ABD2CH66_VESMC|nr:proteasomal ubiquitin receptor ADRM1 isoform X1 [Vespula pensylvanica]XP_043674064.1 proteasomal ubiquitin receptor ADRM1 isoform X2 [Vespula pensylvanica]XP_050856651.1 proteasomal ubiquitin receptor ADRM1 isoform X1 [Vespula vulgaris]